MDESAFVEEDSSCLVTCSAACEEETMLVGIVLLEVFWPGLAMAVWSKGLARIFGLTLIVLACFVGEIGTCASGLREVSLISDKSQCDKFESLKNLGKSALALLIKPVIFSLSRFELVNLPLGDVGALSIVVRCAKWMSDAWIWCADLCIFIFGKTIIFHSLVSCRGFRV